MDLVGKTYKPYHTATKHRFQFRKIFCTVRVLLIPSIQSDILLIFIKDDTDINVSVNFRGVWS